MVFFFRLVKYIFSKFFRVGSFFVVVVCFWLFVFGV